MIPVVAEVEPVTEDTLRLQAQIVKPGRACISRTFLPWRPIGNPVVGAVRIERTFAELKLVGMLVPAVIRLEDGIMEQLQRLVAADFNYTADLLVGELLAGRPSSQEDR